MVLDLEEKVATVVTKIRERDVLFLRLGTRVFSGWAVDIRLGGLLNASTHDGLVRTLDGSWGSGWS